MKNLRYNNGRINSAETPFKIPDTWMWVKLGDISSITTGSKDANEGDVDGEYDFFTCALIPIKSKVYSFSGEYLILPGNGANVGKCIHYNGKFEAYQRTYVVQCYNVFMKYIYWVIEAKWAKYNQDKLFGSAIPYIKLSNLEEFPIPLPPLAEQKRIVEKIEELEPLINRYGKAAEELARIKSAFPEDLRNSILQQAIEGKLVPQNLTDEPASELLKRIKQECQQQIKEGKIKPSKLPKSNEPLNPADMPFKIPDSWTWCRLEDIGQIVGGGTPNTDNINNWDGGTIPWLTPADMKNIKGKYISNGERNITEYGLAHSSAQIMPKGSLVYSSRAPIGYIAIAKNDLCTNQGFKSLVPYDFRIIPYLYFVLIARTPEIISRASGTTFLEISGTEFGKTSIPLPPLNEQQRIISQIDTLFDLCDNLEQIVN